MAEPGIELSQTLDKKEMVRWAYRLFLDREPESDAVLSGRSQDTRSLRAEFMTCEEFIVANPHFSMLHDDWIIKITKYGFRLFVYLREVAISKNILLDNYEKAEVAFVQSVVKPGHTVIDIGANIGFYAMLFSSIVGPAGQVHAFEPVPFLYDKLNLSRQENRFENICQTYNCALGAEPGTLNLFHAIGGMNFGGSHLLSEPVGLRRVSKSDANQLIGALAGIGYRCALLLPDGTLGETITEYAAEAPINVVFSAA